LRLGDLAKLQLPGCRNKNDANNNGIKACEHTFMAVTVLAAIYVCTAKKGGE